MRVLIIEDSPQRMRHFRRNLIGAEVVIAKTSGDAIQWMSQMSFDVIFFDYDLHIYTEHGNPQKSGTGLGAAAWLRCAYMAEPRAKKPLIIVHSLNEGGGEAIYKTLEREGFPTYRHPFAWAEPELLETLVKEGRWAA